VFPAVSTTERICEVSPQPIATTFKLPAVWAPENVTLTVEATV
jgi:hypothetical protein